MGSEFNSSQPIYYQIMQQIYGRIFRNEFELGQKLPSVRDFAIDVGVNPNTIKRVYNELERLGIVETKRGQGTFVTENPALIDLLRQEQMNKQVNRFIKDMLDMGLHQDVILKAVQTGLDHFEK